MEVYHSGHHEHKWLQMATWKDLSKRINRTKNTIDWINHTGRIVVSMLFCMSALASVWSVLDPWSLIKIHQERKIDEIDLYTVLVVVCKCCAKFFILSDRRWLWPFEGWIRSHHNFPISTKCQENWLLMDSLCLYIKGEIYQYTVDRRLG